MSDSVRPHGRQPTRLGHPWDCPGKSTGVGCHCLLRRQTLTDIKGEINSNTIIVGDFNTPVQYSCLENPMDGGAWWATVYGVTMSQTWLSDFTFTFHFHTLEKEMETHSSVLAWRIPGMGEPGGLPSMGSHRVGHDWRDLAAAAAAEYGSNLDVHWQMNA